MPTTTERPATVTAPKPTAKEQAAMAKAAKAAAADRAKLAAQVKKLRDSKVPWDGDNGICAQLGLSGAPQGRKLLREAGAGDMIAASYDRDEARAKRESEAAKA